MTSFSGQVNFYKYNLVSDLSNSHISKIVLRTSRDKVLGNYVMISISNNFRNNESLSTVSNYFQNRFQSFGAKLSENDITFGGYTDFSSFACESKEKGKNIIPLGICVPARSARAAINDCFAHHEMSAENRSEIEMALRELEKSEAIARKRLTQISTAQKDIICSFISPYVEEIKNEAHDAKTAESWIEYAAHLIKLVPERSKQALFTNFQSAFPLSKDFSSDFYESLYAIGKVYASMGDLEGALLQSGIACPSQELVRETILSAFLPQEVQINAASQKEKKIFQEKRLL